MHRRCRRVGRLGPARLGSARLGCSGTCLLRSSCPASYSEFRDIHEKLLRLFAAKQVRFALSCPAERVYLLCKRMPTVSQETAAGRLSRKLPLGENRALLLNVKTAQAHCSFMAVAGTALHDGVGGFVLVDAVRCRLAPWRAWLQCYGHRTHRIAMPLALA
jgi:hypothetical protein